MFILLYRCIDSALTLVPVPHGHPVNNTLVVGIYTTEECPDGYYRAKRTDNSRGNIINKGTSAAPDLCTLCSKCRKGERELEKCTSTQNTQCGCFDGREYHRQLEKCIPKIGLEKNWTLQDYYTWRSSISPPPTSQPQVENITTKISQDVPVVNANSEMKPQAEHAVKPDWTDFYILTVSSTAVLFFTLSLVLLFLMAVMKARSWYLYRRLPGSGITLCFRGWLSRLLLRQRDRSTDPIQEISMTGRVVQLTDQGTTARELEDKNEDDNQTCREEPVLVSSSPTEEERPPKTEHLIDNAEVIDYLKKINAIVCCADLKLTFPEKTTYVSSCITSEADVKETRSQGNPNFILQACHDTVNVVLGHKSHKCCRNRNMLTLTSSDECALGQYEAATLEVQDWSVTQFKEIPAISLSADTAETSFLLQVSSNSCKHQEDDCIHPDGILNLYTEIAAPFKQSRDLKFNGSLQLYLKKGSSSYHPVIEKVKSKGGRMTKPFSDSEEREALLESQEENVNDSVRAQNSILKERPHSTESEESFGEDYPSIENNSEVLLPPTSQGCMQYNLSSRKESPYSLDGCEGGVGGDDIGPLTNHKNIESCIPLGQYEIDSCRAWSGDCAHDEAVDEGAVEVVVDVHSDVYCPEGEQESERIPQEDESDSTDESQPLNLKTDCRKMKKLLVVTSV